ncbi:MAG: thiamine biosynthesis protein ThiS [Marinilabiliales bacterium]|jgi:thiamine biosynthesis protein ThiS|nr:MAG: thiamine biosynthesis protein ThiS [Marinilabiliales bacterium]
MNISLNNRPESFEQDVLTISEILKLKNFTFRMMVVKINGQLIKKDRYQTAEVTDGDDVQIIHMISGG